MTKNTKIAIGVVGIGLVSYYLWEKSKKDAANDAAKAAALKTTLPFTAQGNQFYGVNGQAHNDMALSHIAGTQITESEHRILSQEHPLRKEHKVIQEPLNAYGGAKKPKNNNSPMFNLAINKAW
jgi:hypothetical protein